MKSVVKVFSVVLIVASIFIFLVIKGTVTYDVVVQNKIIDDIYVKKIDDDSSYLGYIYIPKYNVKRLIKDGTSSSILDDGFVGKHRLSTDDFLILAGHNTSHIFGVLHKLSIDDEVYINSNQFSHKYLVYNMLYVNEYEMSYLYNSKHNELLLITCTDKKGERLLVRLREVV